MNLRTRLLAPTLAALLGLSSLSAADPAPAPLLPYQGRLIEAGVAANGSRICSFAILDSGNNELWSSGNQTLTITEGLYSTLLGGAGMPPIPTSVLLTAGMKLRVTIAGQVMSPDVALVPVMQARSAWVAETVTGTVALANGGTGATDAATARSNLGLGTAAVESTSAFASAAQGAKADTAVQPAALGGAAALNVGTVSGTVAAGDDPRFTDARVPADGAVSSAKIADGAIVDADINAAAAIGWAKIDKTGAAMTGADGTTGGSAGLAPAPAAGDQGRFLRGDGTWATVGSSSLPTQTGNGGKFLATDGTTEAWTTVPTTTDAAALSTGTLAAARLPALSGDVTSSAGSAATTVATVGGISAASAAAGATLANAATNANTASAIVRRDASGNFSAGTVTATAFSGSGAALTSLNASGIASGTVPTGNLPVLVGDAGTGGSAGIAPAPAAGDAGKFLRGDGTWAAAGGGGSLPTQTGNGGKFLATDGTTEAWTTVPTTTDAAALSTGTLAAARLPALSGDVTSSAGSAATTVATVGGISAASAAAGATLANAATSANTASAIVKRDASGNFSAGTITATAFSGSGASLTSLNASSIASGTIPAANLPAVVGDSGAGGTRGAVPAPAAGDAAAGKFLKADGTWATAPTTTDAAVLSTGTLAAARLPALSGDVTSSAGSAATTVATVGGISAASAAAGATLANAATNANTASAIVRRDASGNFSAGTITATAFSGSGASLTSLNASSIASGTVPAANLPAVVGDSGAGGTKGAVPAPAAGDAAAGKFLKADGTWAVAGGSSLPTQTGNGGKFLTTDGTSASWSTPSTNAASIQSNAVSSSAPAVGDTLVWSGAAWAPASANKVGSIQVVAAPAGAFTANVLTTTDILIIDKQGDNSAVTGTVNFPASYPHHKILRITSLGWSNEGAALSYNIDFHASGADKIMSLGTRTAGSAATTWSGCWSEWTYDSGTATWYMLNCY